MAQRALLRSIMVKQLQQTNKFDYRKKEFSFSDVGINYRDVYMRNLLIACARVLIQ